jgi:ribosomal protein L1
VQAAGADEVALHNCKASFDEKSLAENCGVALDEILRAKPASSKGRYLRRSPSR